MALTIQDQKATYEAGIAGGLTPDVASSIAGGYKPQQINTQQVATPTTTTQPFTITDNLKVGSTGQSVSNLQTFLNTQGANLSIDSKFGPQTAAAVKQFQTSQGLTPDAIVGPNTTAMINAQSGITGGTLTPPPADPLGTGVPDISSTGLSLPTSNAGNIAETYLNSISNDLLIARTNLENTYQKQIDDLNRKQQEAQDRINEFTSQQEDVLGNVDTLTQPYREALENAERERLYINENFEANQKLTNELETLLSEGNALISQTKGVTGLAGIRNPRVNQAIDAVNARVGVIQATMSARDNQIAQAYTMIDRSVEAINADRNSRLDYYNALYDFYEGQKDDEIKKLTTLTSEKKDFLNAQIALIENDLAQSQETSNYIKELITTPESALFMSQAGVTLNDTIPQINAKMAVQAQRQELIDTRNDYISEGYIPTATAGVGTISIQAGGKTLYFKPPVKKTTTGTTVKTTESERMLEGVSSINSVLIPGATLPTGETIINPDGGYINPGAWVELIRHSPEVGVSREEFLKNYGGYLLIDKKTNKPHKNYKLTPNDLEILGY